jgi:hypothetical protein
VSGRGFASAALDGSQHPRGEGQEQPGAGLALRLRLLVLRSGLIAAQLMGLAFMRFVWKIEPLASLDDAAVVAAIAPTIQRYLDGDVYAATRQAPPAG